MAVSPLVSVVMPSYNHEEFLGCAIESVLSQSMTDLELIVVDDASSDDSASILADYVEADARVRAAYHETNQGIAKTMNDALGMSNGKYIAHTASDDIWNTSKLEQQLNALSQHSGSVVWSEGKLIDADGDPIGKTFTGAHGATEKPKSGNLFSELSRRNYIFGSSLLYPEQLAEGLRWDPELRYLNDYKYVLELAARGEFVYVDKALALYRRHDSNTTDTADWERVTNAETIKIIEYLISEYKDRLGQDNLGELTRRKAVRHLNQNEHRETLKSLLSAIQTEPLSTRNILYLGYLCAGLVPGGQAVALRFRDSIRSVTISDSSD